MGSTNQDRVLEALADLVTPETKEKVAAVVTSLLDEAVADLEEKFKAQYNAELAEGYKTIADEREKDWQTATTGYQQAYEIIADLRARLEKQNEEFEQTLIEEYQKAYQMILDERKKAETLSEAQYEESNKQIETIKEFLIDKMDEFMNVMGEEYYDIAKREVLNDPCLAEHRIAFERVLDVAKDYLSDEDIMLNTNSKVEELEQKLESVEVAKRQLESKNTRLMTENSKIHEYLRETKELIEKNILNEQNERLEKASKVEGRGKVNPEPQRQVVIGEAVDSTATDGSESVESNKPKTITETWTYLAGLKQ